MQVGDLFQKPEPVDLPPVPATFYPALHPTVREVMTEWVGRTYRFDALAAEVLSRVERRKPPGPRPRPPPMSED